MLESTAFLIAVYNNLRETSSYRSDLVALFGTPDGSNKGYLGTMRRPLRWDWGITGFRKTMKILYILSGHDPDAFNAFYEHDIMHRDGILPTLLAKQILHDQPKMLYIFKYRVKRVPAFTATIHDFAWKDRRIWITFEPDRYFMIDPTTWDTVRDQLFTKGREDPEKWHARWTDAWTTPQPPRLAVERMLVNRNTMDQYHVFPTKLLLDVLSTRNTPSAHLHGGVFMKDVTFMTRRTKQHVATDNQVIWGLLAEYTGKTQVKGTIVIHGPEQRSITDIPSNTISEESLVFKQEIGAAQTICQAIYDVFGDHYLDVEFPHGAASKDIRDSNLLKRAVKVSMVAQAYEKRYANTDYDYELNLTPLLPGKQTLKILFDLTAGLWNKGVYRLPDDYLKQWIHNQLTVPTRNPELHVVWHYGLRTEIKDGSYQGQEVGDYLRAQRIGHAVKYTEGVINASAILPQCVLLPFFRDSDIRLEQELNNISNKKTLRRYAAACCTRRCESSWKGSKQRSEKVNPLDANTTLEPLKRRIKDFVHNRAWEQFHNPKDLALSISVEAAELLELFQWQSADAVANAVKRPSFLERIGEELADVVIYALSLANALNLDLSTIVTAKIDANASKYPVSEYYGVYKK